MDELKIIIQGYAQKEASGRYNATSATVLVRSRGKLVLVDPGMNPNELKVAFDTENLKIDDIDIVVVSHSHPDHTRNRRLFDKAKFLDLFSLYQTGKDSSGNVYIPETNIEVVHTPGHVDKHFSLLIDTTGGKYAIAGDVFWWEDNEEQKLDVPSLIGHVDPVAKDQAVLQNTRKKLLDMADSIIPGHGRVFPAPEYRKGVLG
jgi:glyoxylase-like metal-dependent hydrolase (beta-lactamase superfamily II)